MMVIKALERTILTALILAVLVSAAMASASAGTDGATEERAPRVVTLQEAVALAMKGNPELIATENATEASKRGVGAARSYLLPKIRLEERYMKTDNPMYAFGSKLNQERIAATDFNPDLLNDPDAVDDFQTTISVEQALFAPEAYMGLKMAKKEAEASGYDFQRKKEEVTLNVITAYMNVLTSRNYVEAAQKGLEDTREHARIAKARYNAGLGQYSDTLRTEVSVRQAQERYLKALKGRKLAGRMLSLLMGLDAPVDVSGEGIELNVKELEEYLAAAHQRFDLKAMKSRVENASNNVKMTKARYLPIVGIGGTWQTNSETEAFGSDGQSYTVMAFLKWDIYDGGMKRAQRLKAGASRREAESYYEGLKKKVDFEVYEAYLELEESQQSLELAQSREDLAKENGRLITSRYENSLATVVELLDAQSALNAARAGVVEKRNNYTIAIARLKYASGILYREYIKE